MKPKHKRFKFIALPAIIVLPAITLALGGVINPDANGDITVTTVNDGANSALATGGLSATPTVVVQSTAVLTGDAVIQNAIRVTAPNYTIFNDGFLSGNLQGVFADALSSGSLTLDNAAGATIVGQSDGILLSADGGLIFNSGSILGQGGVASDGIQGLSNEISGNVLAFNTITKNGAGLALIGTVADAGTGLNITADTIQIDSGALLQQRPDHTNRSGQYL